MPADAVGAAPTAAAATRRRRRSWPMFWRVFAAMVATIIAGSWSFAALFGVYQDRATAASLAPLWAEALRDTGSRDSVAATRRVEIPVEMRAGEPPPRSVDLRSDTRTQAMAAELRARGVAVREIRLDDSLDPPVTWLRIERNDGVSRWTGLVGGLQPSGYGRRLGLGLLALVAIALAVATAMSRWVAAPLARLVAQVDGVAAGEAPKARVRGAREIERLGDAVAAMAERRFADEQQLRMMLLGVSHDLRSPLARIRVAADLLDAGSEGLRDTIVRNVVQADRIIESFLTYVRAEEDRADGAVDLGEIAAGASEGRRSASTRVAGVGPIWVQGNATMLRRLVANLVDNAEQHGAPPIEIEVSIAAGGREALLCVVDRGAGIADPARLRRAFERGDAARATEGAGLGLAIVDRIAERHGGSVEIGQPPGGGTVVSVRLSLASNRDGTG